MNSSDMSWGSLFFVLVLTNAPLFNAGMQEGALDKFIVGLFLALVGLAIIIFHKSIKKRYDWWQSRDWPVGLGDAWTGKYTHGGQIFIYTLIILIGVVFLAIGVSRIVAAFA